MKSRRAWAWYDNALCERSMMTQQSDFLSGRFGLSVVNQECPPNFPVVPSQRVLAATNEGKHR